MAAIHNGCIGAGIDLITACDIRYCSQDAIFSVKVSYLFSIYKIKFFFSEVVI